MDTTGTFDDSVALDIDRDGSIDFLTGEGDALATPGISGNNKYTPWVNSSPFKLSAIITNTGTTVTAYWGGVQINVGSASDIPFTSNFTLQDWAGSRNMNAAGMILRNNFTSNVIRFGSLNEFREGGHNISFDIDTVILTEKNGTMHTFDPDRDGTFNPPTQAVPEPSSSALLLLGAGLGLARRKRRV